MPAPSDMASEVCEKSEEECIELIKSFAKDGLPGLHNLYQILPRIFNDFNMLSPEKQDEILFKSGLTPDFLQSFVKPALVAEEPCGGKTEHDCVEYIKGFLNGGLPAIARLKQVLPSLFKYFKVETSDEKANILIKCGLRPYIDKSKADVTFFFRDSECRDHLWAPKSVSYDWEFVREPDYCSPSSEVPFVFTPASPVSPSDIVLPIFQGASLGGINVRRPAGGAAVSVEQCSSSISRMSVV